MSIVVTGALGFVAINIVRDLAAFGHEVIAVDRTRPDALAKEFLESVSSRITLVEADLTSDDWATALAGERPQLVVHAAAITPLAQFEAPQSVPAVEVNVAGTARVLHWAAASGVRRVIHVSTGSVYGPVDGDRPVDEDVPQRPTTVYGITKSAGERIAWRIAELSGVDLVVLRLSHIYGPMERQSAARGVLSPVERWTRAAIDSTPIEGPDREQRRDFLNVADVAAAVRILVKDGWSGRVAYNVSSGLLTSEVELVEALRAITPALVVGDASTAGSPNIRRPALAIDRIGRDIGWRPSIELGEGLRRYVEWRRASGG